MTPHELQQVASLFHSETQIEAVRGGYVASLGGQPICSGPADKVARALYKAFKQATREEENKLAEQEAKTNEARRRLAALRALVKGGE